MIHCVAKLLRRISTPPSAVVEPPPTALTAEIAAAGLSRPQWIAARRAAARLYADISDAELSALRERFPQQVEQTGEAAARILAHQFDLLGSGPYVPVDRGRAARGSYVPIDWYLDPVRSLRFPERVPYKEWNLFSMRPGLADVKLPWELARCQHWVTLGQVYRLTGDERYAREIIDEHDDFVEANPVGFGIHWTCTMDVAIRALNWALAIELIRTSAAAASSDRVFESLFDHGTFIERNLENKYEVTSNHFLSNVVGLFALGLLFRDLPSGARWRAECRGWLVREMQVQVLPDGADYESSIPYHRLVAELFLSGARLAQLDGNPLPAGYDTSLRRMIDFLAAVLRPDGLLPQVGDADNGRVQMLSEYGAWNPQDARHLFATAAAILDEPAWAALSGPWGEWEAAWWGHPLTATEASPRVGARLFEHAGVALARDARAYLLVTNGRVGTSGFGNHKHNDLLGFEFHADGVPLVVDAGSYVYTSDPDARNLFRSTRWHNTLRIDGVEQNDLKPEFLFRLFETSEVQHLAFDDTPEFVEYRGSHTGYMRLPSPVRHERTLRLMKSRASLTIVDTLRGGARHRIDWHFHFAPGIRVERSAPDAFVLCAPAARFRLRIPASLTASIADGWYSPSYGVRIPCRALELTVDAVVADATTYTFSIEPVTSETRPEWRIQ